MTSVNRYQDWKLAIVTGLFIYFSPSMLVFVSSNSAGVDLSFFFFGEHLQMCEREFSALTNRKKKCRSMLNIKSDLRFCLSQIVPRSDELCNVKQAHPFYR